MTAWEGMFHVEHDPSLPPPVWAVGMVGCEDCGIRAWAMSSDGDTNWDRLAAWWMSHMTDAHPVVTADG